MTSFTAPQVPAEKGPGLSYNERISYFVYLLKENSFEKKKTKNILIKHFPAQCY